MSYRICGPLMIQASHFRAPMILAGVPPPYEVNSHNIHRKTAGRTIELIENWIKFRDLRAGPAYPTISTTGCSTGLLYSYTVHVR